MLPVDRLNTDQQEYRPLVPKLELEDSKLSRGLFDNHINDDELTLILNIKYQPSIVLLLHQHPVLENNVHLEQVLVVE